MKDTLHLLWSFGKYKKTKIKKNICVIVCDSKN